MRVFSLLLATAKFVLLISAQNHSLATGDVGSIAHTHSLSSGNSTAMLGGNSTSRSSKRHRKHSTSMTAFTPAQKTVVRITVVTTTPQSSYSGARPTVTITTYGPAEKLDSFASQKLKPHSSPLGSFTSAAGKTTITLASSAVPAALNAVAGNSSSDAHVHSTAPTGVAEACNQLIITVTDMITVTKTSCPASVTSSSLVKLSHYSLATEHESNLAVNATMASKTHQTTIPTSVPMVSANGAPLSPSNEPPSQPSVYTEVFTAWSTAWNTVTVLQTVSASNPAIESQTSSKKSHVHNPPQEPIDQAYAKPMDSIHDTMETLPSPVFSAPAQLPKPRVEKPTSWSNKTEILTTHHVYTPLRGTQISGQPLATITKQDMAPVSSAVVPTQHTAPIIPNIPYGHPPAFSSHPGSRNHASLVLDHTISKGQHTGPFNHKTKDVKCTTTFAHTPTHPCTSTQFASTTKLPVNCHGCIGEQPTPFPAYHQSVCQNATTITVPVRTMSVCAYFRASFETTLASAVDRSGFMATASAV